jgi:hypothetical protein
MAICLSMGALGAVVLPPVTAEAQVDLEGAAARFAQLGEQLETLRNQRSALEREYRDLTDEIAARKRAGDPQKLLGDLNLQALLTRGRSVAEDLYGIQSRIRDVETQLETSRREVISGFDSRLNGLEKGLVEGSGSRRTAIIAEMNRLRQSRHQYVAAAASTPDLNLADIPSFDTAEDDPEEALAAAAELDDANRKVRSRIDELDGEIASLEAERRLRRKARGFREKESFFDEAQKGGRRVAVRPTGARTASGTDGAGVGGAAPNQNDAADEANRGEPGTESEGAPAESDADGADGDAALGGDRGTDDDGETLLDPGGPDPVATGAGDAGSVPELGTPVGPFVGDAGIVIGEVEPEGSVSEGPEDEGLEARLRRHRRERKQLEGRSRQLERRSGDLKRLADDF